jgi:predicted permease
MMWDAEIEGYARRPDEAVTLYASHVGPEYFRAAGTRIVAGRAFSAQDTAAAPRVAIVNEALAERYFGGRSAIGGRIKPFRGDWLTVVGVAGNTTVRRLGERPLPCIYLAFDQTLAGQNSNALDAAHLFVRTSGDVEALLPLLRDRLRSLDPALPLFDVQPFARHVRELVMPQRMGVTLFALFSTLALALALIGIYGVASYVAALRTREIGIRIALGAGARDIGRLVLTQGLAPLAIGLVAGALLAVWAARFASAFLYDVDPSDPLTLAATTGVLAAAGLAAVSVPARRAARLDPVTALRRD